MALDPEEIVTLLLLAALAIAWNWRLGTDTPALNRRRDRPYCAGRSPDWIKVKNRKHPVLKEAPLSLQILCVVIGAVIFSLPFNLGTPDLKANLPIRSPPN